MGKSKISFLLDNPVSEFFLKAVFWLYQLAIATLAYGGYEHFLWKVVAAIVVGMLWMGRASLPLMIPAFYAAVWLYNWHWLVALIFIFPSILFMATVIASHGLGSAMSLLTHRRSRDIITD